MYYNDSFYPTPPEVASRMLAPFSPDYLAKQLILEPQVGKGDLADVIYDKIEKPWARSDAKKRIHCLEIEPELQAAARGKGYQIVGHDFFSFSPDEKYTLIVMNPPFRNGEKHLLHAWEILHYGDVACLLNQSSIDGPNPTADQQLLREIIRQHGEIEPLGPCFSGEDAFRKTSVNVALIRLHKPKPVNQFSFSADGLGHEQRPDFDFSGFDNQISRRDIILDTVERYKASLNCFHTAMIALAELGFYSADIGKAWKAGQEPIRELIECRQPDAELLTRLHNDFVAKFKKSAWAEVMHKSKISRFLSQQVESEFNSMCDENANLAFSVENIMMVFDGIFHSRFDIMQKCIVEAFDNLTSYYKENRMIVEGWRTNDAYKVNRRVILGRIIDCDFSVRVNYNRIDTINDLDRALSFISGRQFDKILTIERAFDRHFQAVRGRWNQTPFQSEFFECRAYKKGSLHLYFLDPDLWENFNIVAAKGKNWLPDNYKSEQNPKKDPTEDGTEGDLFTVPRALPCPPAAPAAALI